MHANEKSSQVARMGEVYGCAREVLSFLASPSPETDDVLDQVNKNFHTTIREFSPSLFVGFFNLLTNEYWRRAWVFQELAMATTISIHCGSRTTSLDAILALLRRFNEMNVNAGFRGAINGLRLLPHAKPLFSQWRKHGLTPTRKPPEYVTKRVYGTFLDVLRSSRGHYACQDPRDMLYSRMALASDAAMMIPYPDYHMSVEELYKRFATNHIIITGSLDIVTFARNSALQLPTWVPDWTSEDIGWHVDTTYNSLQDSLTLLSWSDIGLPRISRCRSELMVQGRVLMTIQKHSIEALFTSAYSTLIRYAGSYPLSEVPRRGDFICVLRGCPLLVYLRAVGQHFIVVGRHFVAHNKLSDPRLGLITTAETKDNYNHKTWSLTSVDAVQTRPEEVFRIQ